MSCSDSFRFDVAVVAAVVVAFVDAEIVVVKMIDRKALACR